MGDSGRIRARARAPGDTEAEEDDDRLNRPGRLLYN
jgi:hypothetical protein